LVAALPRWVICEICGLNSMSDYSIVSTPPDLEDYLRLRAAAGLSSKGREAARIGLSNSWFAVHVVHEGKTVGMGRIIGDGGCFFQVVDIAALPDHQGRGLGKRIMAALMEYFEAHAPESAYMSLIADGKAKDLYAQFGFKPTAPASIGMWRKKS